MDLLELQRRIEQWEDLHTEFKEWPVRFEDLAVALVAFSNTDGGQLILGVSKDGSIQGVPDPDKVMQGMDNIAYNNIEPPLTIVQETITDENNNIIVVVNVPKGEQRPYRTNRGEYYIRTTSGRRRASRQELLRLFQATETFFYDETLLLRASIRDIDTALFESYLRTVYQRSLEDFQVPFETLLSNLGLVKIQEDGTYPTVACILFFGKEPQKQIPHARIAAARIPGTDLASAPSDAKQIDGRLLTMLEDMVRFLRIHLRTKHEIKGFEPEVRSEIPEEALREIVVNTLAHRDYTVTGPARIIIFDDRVEIRSPGGLPNTVTIEAMKLGSAHVLRNPKIYTLLSQHGLVTGIGSGVYRSNRLIMEHTGKEMDIFLEGIELVFSIPREI